MRWIFHVSFWTLLYIYLGYPALVWVLARAFGREPRRKDITPAVSLLIPAYNEAAHIDAKLRNSLALQYPRELLEIVVASDGSTDRTNAIVEQFRAQGVKLLAMTRNIGKAAMLSRTVPLLRGDVVVFSDASGTLEPGALRALVRSFADPAVGCVSGLYRLHGAADPRSEGEGLYWRYETFIKAQESRLHSILGAHGAFYGIRRLLFQRVGEFEINDDYLIPMRIVAAGHRAVYEPRAVAWEEEAASMEGEFARRRRIAAGNCQQMVMLRGMLHPSHGWVAFCFFSHKVLRTIAPILMATLLFSTPWLPQLWARVMGALQACFYTAALAGYAAQRRGRALPLCSAPFYFCLGNLAMLAGLWKYFFSKEPVVWERAH